MFQMVVGPGQSEDFCRSKSTERNERGSYKRADALSHYRGDICKLHDTRNKTDAHEYDCEKWHHFANSAKLCEPNNSTVKFGEIR